MGEPAFTPLMETFGRVHAYLIDDGDGLTLVDALGKDDGRTIFDALERMGRRPSELRRIVLTHAHPTHVKGAAVLKRASGARVFAPFEEQDIIEGHRPSNHTTWIPRRPYRVLIQQYLLNLQHSLWQIGIRPMLINVPPVVVDEPFERDDVRIGPLITIRTPGHSPGSTSFYWPETRTLFAGDALVTWPKFEAGWQGLTEDYAQNLRSLQRLVKLFEQRGWQINAFASGHGAPLFSQDGLGDLKRLLAGSQDPS
jgi:glyoxylase-like metal-dependent hydrolase (beta-lactamase superfamily II)